MYNRATGKEARHSDLSTTAEYVLAVKRRYYGSVGPGLKSRSCRRATREISALRLKVTDDRRLTLTCGKSGNTWRNRGKGLMPLEEARLFTRKRATVFKPWAMFQRAVNRLNVFPSRHRLGIKGWPVISILSFRAAQVDASSAMDSRKSMARGIT
jgi:hypothetical protein